MKWAALLGGLAAAGAVALLPALTWRARAWDRYAELAMLARAPMPTPAPIVGAGVAFHGADEAASAALASTVRVLAAREGALVERSEPLAGPGSGLVSQHAVVSGNARAALRFVEAVETRTPVVRLSRYRLAANTSGRSLRLEADLVMAVEQP